METITRKFEFILLSNGNEVLNPQGHSHREHQRRHTGGHSQRTAKQNGSRKRHKARKGNGQAQLGFLSHGQVPGFGRLTRLVDALAHRLVLQEDLTRSIAEALIEHTDTPASACVVQARHTCVAVVDPARVATVFRTTALSGDPQQAADLLRQIDVSLTDPSPRASEGGQPHP